MAKPDKQRYMVVMDGTVMVGAESETVIKKLSRLFGSEPENVEAMLRGEPLVIKKNLTAQRAHQYFRTISNAGAACHLEEFNPSDATGHAAKKTSNFPDSELVSGSSVKFSDHMSEDEEIRQQIEERIRQLEDTGQFRIDDLASRRTNDKIVFLSLILLIFALLAAVYFIV